MYPWTNSTPLELTATVSEGGGQLYIAIPIFIKPD